MEFYQNYYETGRRIRSKAAQNEYYGALIRYLYDGEEPEFRSEQAEIAFFGVRPSARKQHAKRMAKLGHSNAEQTLNKPTNKTGTNAEQTDQQTPNKTGTTKGTNEEQPENNEGIKLVSCKAVKLSSNDYPPIPPSDFPLRCLDALNRVMGATYSTMPTKCVHTLQRCADKYTLDDVESMIRYKREEWLNTQYANCLTPNTLFSPDHFEQYMHQAKGQVKEVNEYAAYD